MVRGLGFLGAVMGVLRFARPGPRRMTNDGFSIPGPLVFVQSHNLGSGVRRVAPKRGCKWTGADLREIRARNGCGRPPAVTLARRAAQAERSR